MKRNSFIWIVFLWPVLFGFSACHKDKNPEPEEESLYKAADLYFVGGQFSEGVNGITQPYYYKNWTSFALDLPENMMANPRDIAVHGTDVYVVGNAESLDESNSVDKTRLALMWTNGRWEQLETPPAQLARVNGIFLDGEDVYAVGYYLPTDDGKKQRGVVWKNGICQPITDGSVSTVLEDLFVLNNDVYVVGYENVEGKITSKYWKNGQAVVLSDPKITTYANSIFVDQNNVYTAGFADALDDRSLKVWKNGQSNTLISTVPVVRGATVVVEHSHVYVIGYHQVGSKYSPLAFKNQQQLQLEDDNPKHTYTQDLAIWKDDVLVLGQQTTENRNRPILWINGTPKDLSSLGESTLLTAFEVVPKDQHEE